MTGRVWIVTELYRPELTSVGHYMTTLAEDLAVRGVDVGVITSRPTYGAHGTQTPRREMLAGVEVRRCRSTAFHKDRPVGRVVNLVTFTVGAFLTALTHVRRGDVVVAQSNPPTLPAAGVAAARLRRAVPVVLWNDLPHVVLTAVSDPPPGRRRRLLAGFAARMTRSVSRAATSVVAMGRPPADELVAIGVPLDRIEVIGTWADEQDVVPLDPTAATLRGELGLASSKVALSAGAMGRAQDLDVVLDAAALIADRTDVAIVLCGEGPARPAIERAVRTRGLDQVMVIGPYPRSEQTEMYGIGDAALVTLRHGMGRSSMPSRAYNALAAGLPIVASADPDSELAMLLAELDVGTTVPPGDPARLAAAIERALDDPAHAQRRAAARAAAEGPCSSEVALGRWRDLLDRLTGPAD